MNRFQFFPTDTPSGNNSQPEHHSTPILPSKDADRATLGVAVAAAWKTHPQLTLIWITQAVFEQKANEFDTVFGQRLTAGSGRSAQTFDLKSKDKEIDGNLKYVKGYILEKWKDAAAANYPRYGMQYRNEAFEIPRDHDKRLDALKLLKQAIHDDGFDAREYGKVYWEKMYTDYDLALKAAKTSDASVSGFVGDKNVLRETMEEALTAIVHLITANYPKTYPQKLREFGFQKEDY